MGFDIPFPSKAQLQKVGLGLLLLVALLVAGSFYLGGRRAVADTHAIELERATELKRLDAARKADSAAAFQAGRLYQQRLDADKLRQQDEIHAAHRPVSGGLTLPDLRARP